MHFTTEVRALMTQLEIACEELARQKGIEHLSGPQGHVIVFLSRRSEQLTFVKDIEEELAISKSVASNLVKRMEKNGFIATVPSVTDKRCKQVVLTQLGQQKIALLQEFHEQVKEYLFKGISTEAFEQVRAVVAQLTKNIEEYKGETHA